MKYLGILGLYNILFGILTKYLKVQKRKKKYLPAYGEDSSLSALTFIPPVTLQRVSLPERSVMWIKVSLKVAKMWATANTFSPS